MTTFAQAPAALKGLFRTLDGAPQQQMVSCAKLLEYRCAKQANRNFPAASDIDPACFGEARDTNFLFECSSDPRRCILKTWASVPEGFLGSCRLGEEFAKSPQPRAAVQLGRLFDKFRQAGEPSVFDFSSIVLAL